jgi:hypothetical protein
MARTTDEILYYLRGFVAGRGRSDNFCYSKVYSSSSYIRCIDFSPWVGSQLLIEDIFALAVFKAQLSKGSSFGVSINISKSDRNKEKVEELKEDQGNINLPDDELEHFVKEIENILRFPFEEYFMGEIKPAKLDLITSWLLHYSESQLARILMAYNLSLNNAYSYFESYNRIKNTQLRLPSDLANSVKMNDFKNEFRKLPLATRLHLFNILEYFRFSKKPKLRLLSRMTLFETRKIGIDEYESANILRQSKLITSSSDGTGNINPEYVDTVSAALDYAVKITPAFRQWQIEVSDRLSGLY